MDIVIHLSEHMRIFLSVMGFFTIIGLWVAVLVWLFDKVCETDLHPIAPIMWGLGGFSTFIWFVSGVHK